MIRNSVKAIIIVDGNILLIKIKMTRAIFIFAQVVDKSMVRHSLKHCKENASKKSAPLFRLESFFLSENILEKIMSMPPLTQMSTR